MKWTSWLFYFLALQILRSIIASQNARKFYIEELIGSKFGVGQISLIVVEIYKNTKNSSPNY